jgi:hypothetical protein
MKKWKLSKGLGKGLTAAAAIGAGLVAGAGVLGGLPAGQQVTAIIAVSAVVTAIRTAMNWWKVNTAIADKKIVR